MKITTKYDLKDFVYPIKQGGYDEFINCETCEGKGIINVNNTKKTILCPVCWGHRGHKKWKADKWYVCKESYGQIGKVVVEIYDKKYHDGKKEYKYMLDSTGVGSGTLWYEDRLFASVEDAQAECNRKNLLNSSKDERPSYVQKGGSNAT